MLTDDRSRDRSGTASGEASRPRRWAGRMPQPPRFEVIPLPGVAEALEEHLPRGSTVTVTASPRKGLARPWISPPSWLSGGSRRCLTWPPG